MCPWRGVAPELLAPTGFALLAAPVLPLPPSTGVLRLLRPCLHLVTRRTRAWYGQGYCVVRDLHACQLCCL